MSSTQPRDMSLIISSTERLGTCGAISLQSNCFNEYSLCGMNHRRYIANILRDSLADDVCAVWWMEQMRDRWGHALKVNKKDESQYTGMQYSEGCGEAVMCDYVCGLMLQYLMLQPLLSNLITATSRTIHVITPPTCMNRRFCDRDCVLRGNVHAVIMVGEMHLVK